MLDFLSQNWGSILVALIVLGLCGLAVWRLRVQKKKGNCGCGGSCGYCPNAGTCHNKNENKP